MNKFKERQKFLASLEGLIKDIASHSIAVEGSRNINNDTAFEIVVSNEVDTETKLKNLTDYGDLYLDGYVLNAADNTYKLVYCQKSPERKLRDELSSQLTSLGFVILGVVDTSPNKGFIYTVEVTDTELLKKLATYKTLIFDGYTAQGAVGVYEVIYIFS